MIPAERLRSNDDRAAVVDLVIPARDEAENIDPLLRAIPWSHLRHVVVADNGSRDRTAELARGGGAIVVHEAQPGYGAACLAGLRWISQQGDPPLAVAFLDADLADDPAELPRLIDPIVRGEADLVIGSRVRRAQRGALDSHQRFGNWLACRLIHAATRKRYRDLGPMRVIRWDVLQRLNMRDRTWGWTVEMQFKAAAHHLSIVELDVPYRRRRAGRSKISGNLIGSVRAGWKIITTIAALSWDAARQRS